MYINHEDVQKLPSSLLIHVNDIQFRIFFTDDKITCFLCKSVDHTTANCKKNTEVKTKNDYMSDTNATNTLDINTKAQAEDTLPPPVLEPLEETISEWFKEPEPSSPININPEVSHDVSPNETYKRPISESSSPNPPPSLNNLNTSTIFPHKEIATKKPKIRSRSNSSNRQTEKPYEEGLKTVEEFFTTRDPSPITFLQFRYILDNFTLKSMNIHTLVENVNTDITSLMDLLDQIREIVKDRKLKTRLSRLDQLLFQTLPPQQNAT